MILLRNNSVHTAIVSKIVVVRKEGIHLSQLLHMSENTKNGYETVKLLLTQNNSHPPTLKKHKIVSFFVPRSSNV